jgi:hypothetical protein
MGFFSRSNDRQQLTDEQAVERYRYMLRTAPPDTIEQAHEEAFSRLTADQRRLALEQLAGATTPQEHRNASDDPRSLARLATRAEIRQPGILERLFGSTGGNSYRGFGGGGMGFGAPGIGSMLAGSLLASLAGTFIGSAVAHSFLDEHPAPEGFTDAGTDHDLAGDPQGSLEEPGYTEADYEDPGLDDGFDGGGFDDIV